MDHSNNFGLVKSCHKERKRESTVHKRKATEGQESATWQLKRRLKAAVERFEAATKLWSDDKEYKEYKYNDDDDSDDDSRTSGLCKKAQQKGKSLAIGVV